MPSCNDVQKFVREQVSAYRGWDKEIDEEDYIFYLSGYLYHWLKDHGKTDTAEIPDNIYWDFDKKVTDKLLKKEV